MGYLLRDYPFFMSEIFDVRIEIQKRSVIYLKNKSQKHERCK
jgi:hypothetical protein